jgi:hypothetical protein
VHFTNNLVDESMIIIYYCVVELNNRIAFCVDQLIQMYTKYNKAGLQLSFTRAEKRKIVVIAAFYLYIPI